MTPDQKDELTTAFSRLDDAALKQLVGITRQPNVSLRNWWIHGQPAPEVVEGVIEVTPGQAPDVLKELITIPKTRTRLDIFPIGIIQNDLYQIRFRSSGGKG